MITDGIYEKVIAAIREGHPIDKPVLSSKLEAHFNLSGPEIREIIRMARRNKIPIANHEKGGYFYAVTWPELEPTVKDLKGRGYSMIETGDCLEGCFPERTIFD